MLFLYLESYECKLPFIYNQIFKRLRDIFYQRSFAAIKEQKNKLRTYGLFKTDLGIENYLIVIKNLNLRTQMSRFRLSNHTLAIETGRHKRIPVELRFCPFCPTMAETEAHFLILCPTYDTIRNNLFSLIKKMLPNFNALTNEEKMVFLLGRLEARYATDYVHTLFEVRTQTLAQKN